MAPRRRGDPQAGDGFLRQGDPVNIYPFIEAEKACSRSVNRACELLKVSRAAFYQQLAGPSSRERQDAELAGRSSPCTLSRRAVMARRGCTRSWPAEGVGTAASASPGSCARKACAAGQRSGGSEPRSPTRRPLPGRIRFAATSRRMRQRSTAAGAATSPTSARGRGGCTWPPSSTSPPAAWSATRWPITCAPN